jgi:enoyl-CoA hydratase/carnithine racemase
MITSSLAGATGWLKIDRAGKRNALSRAMWSALPATVDTLARDERVRVIVFAGVGPHFSAGADIAEFETVYADRDAARNFAATLTAAMDAVAACSKPSIAMVRGHCIGSAVGLALCCDLRFASADARFAVTPGRLGLAYSFEDTRRLVEAVGRSNAKDLLMTARTIDAQEALHIGLIDRVLDDELLEDRTVLYAAQVAAASTTSVRVARRFVDLAAAGQRHEDEATRKAYLDAVEGPDFEEGRQAFLERREPRFS